MASDSSNRPGIYRAILRTVLIGLSPKPTTGSMLGICFNVWQPWLSTCFIETTCRSRARFRSSSNCSRTKRRARPTLSAPDGVRGSSDLKTWLRGIHHGVSPQHLQAYLNEFTFRFNRRFYPFNAFRSLLGIAGDVTAPTYAELYAKKSQHTTSSGFGS